MKILLIEDKEIGFTIQNNLISNFGDDVTWVKSYHCFTNELKDIHKYNAIVCDHYFPSFLDSSETRENGPNILFELMYEDYIGIFIHCSSEPCPEKYVLNPCAKIKFHSIKKTNEIETSNDLIKTLKTLFGSK